MLAFRPEARKRKLEGVARCRHCGGKVEDAFRFCPWCSTPQRQGLLASSIKLGPEQMPELWQRYGRVLATLDLPEVYDIYLTQYPVANAAAVGAETPMIVINSAALQLFEDDELDTVFAHEAGHILSEHVLYHTALMIILQLVPLGRIPGLPGIPLLAIRSALLEWFRAAEL